MTNSTIQKNRQCYNIAGWGEGYFDIAETGHVIVKPRPLQQTASIDLPKLAKEIQHQGLNFPILVRFPDILHDRVERLHRAFGEAIKISNYQGRYTAVYPIKVNQQRRVVEEIIHAKSTHLGLHKIGLEAGSKPELIAVLASSKPERSVIICNGYKDQGYIRLALLGQRIGHEVYLVIEKLSEIKHILEQAKKLQIKPNLGVRVRLATVGKSNWQNTGGEKAKFGLTSYQLLELITILKAENFLDCLTLLHVHMGSQISNLADIENAMQECAQFYIALRHAGAPINHVDVGGGLGVDYEGTKSRELCSINYSMQDYATSIVTTLAKICNAHQAAHPNIITEAGRAMTAHHAVLITNIVEQETPAYHSPFSFQQVTENIEPLQKLVKICEELTKPKQLVLTEIFHQLNLQLSKIHQLFADGELTLSERARAEQYHLQASQLLTNLLQPELRSHREIIEQLREKLATKLFANFSVFQSVPDVWGIDQIFPIIPLEGLNHPVTARVVIHDLTCDSDGRINHYVENAGIETTLPIPDTKPLPLIGFFLVGAYQEILGDMHNLFGDTNSVDVKLQANGSYQLSNFLHGDTIGSVLRYVNFNPEELQQLLEQQVSSSQLTETEKNNFFAELNNAFGHYTYLD